MDVHHTYELPASPAHVSWYSRLIIRARSTRGEPLRETEVDGTVIEIKAFCTGQDAAHLPTLHQLEATNNPQ